MQLTLAEAAQRAGVNKSTVFRWIKRGAVSGAKTPDGEWRVDAAELHRHLEATASASTSQRGGQRSAPPTDADHVEGEVDADHLPHLVAGNAVQLDAATIERLARLEAENNALKERLEETRERLDEVREDRDRWHVQAERLAIAPPPMFGRLDAMATKRFTRKFQSVSTAATQPTSLPQQRNRS